MFIYFIYILISLILIYVLFLGFRAVNIGIVAKKNNKIFKKSEKKGISKELEKLNKLYRKKVITKQEFEKAKSKILNN
tara:strand:- start:785 stop:1018 length:234 start_codon:yes stop_codon:yes gene_type:complete